MRRNLLLATIGMIVVSAACADVEVPTSGRALRRSSPPVAGAAEDHDDGDTDGADDSDPGNPNADTKPNAPKSAGTTAPQFALTISQNTPTVDLGQEVDIDVVVEPKNGFVGAVDISVGGLPAGATAAPVRATVASASAPSAPTKLKIKAAVDAIPSAPNASSALVITGTSNDITATANANFKIAPKVQLTIPLNIDALRAANVQYRNEWGAAFGQTQTPLRTQIGNGIVVTVFNADSKPHVIHGANGFAHGNTGAPIAPNAFEQNNGAVRTRTLNPGTNANGYPHDGASGPGASFRIKVDEVK